MTAQAAAIAPPGRVPASVGVVIGAPDQQEMIDAGKTEQTIANVGLVFGILGIGAGAGLYLYSENQQTHAKGWRLQANLRQVTLSARF